MKGPLTLSLSPLGRGDPRIDVEDNSTVPSPLGEKDRMKGDFVRHNILQGQEKNPWLTRS